MNTGVDPGRRAFLRLTATAGTGLALGIPLAGCSRDSDKALPMPPEGVPVGQWLEVLDDGRILVFVAEAEMGQEIESGLARLVAEGLDADWSRITVRQAPVHPAWGERVTAGSSSIRKGWLPMLRAGAAARQMLIRAAAMRWQLPVEQLETQAGQVHAPDGRRLDYAALAREASRLPVPAQPPLPPYDRDYRIVGHRLPPIADRERVTGARTHAGDLDLPGMLHATVLHPPVAGARPRTIDDRAARRVPGFHSVFAIEEGVAVVAGHTWAAFRAAERLHIEWSDTGTADMDEDAIFRALEQASRREGVVFVDPGTELETDGLRQVSARFLLPFQAHAPLETACCTVSIANGRCRIWAPTQAATDAREVAARHFLGRFDRLLGKLRGRLEEHFDPLQAIELEVMPMGGAFGRRLQNDHVSEAVQIALHTGRPIRLVWRREEEFRADRLRPAALQVLQGWIDEEGRLAGLDHKVVSPSINESIWPGSKPDGRDSTAVQGARELPYDLPWHRLRYVMTPTPLRLGFWRSVGHSITCWGIERLMDRLARAAGREPLTWRMEQLTQGTPLWHCARALSRQTVPPASVALGHALMQGYDSAIATRVALGRNDTSWHILAIDQVVDCGQVIDPALVRRQIQGATIFGLTAAMKSRIHVTAGAVSEDNFDRFPLLRLPEVPPIRVTLLPSNRAPGGIGELGTPSIGPALANALEALGLDADRELQIPTLKDR